MANVSLEKVVKRYGKLEVVHGIDLDIKDREFIVLVGPSGCGKSTILRMIAGLEEISEGLAKLDDKVINEVPPKDRNMAMVFQNYALYPHKTVYDNMGFSLKMQNKAKAEIDQKVKEAAGILGLAKLLDRKPAALSGGQRQRVAMGRAIVRNPAVFLFDEPLSNLDAKLRTQMRMEIKKLHLRLNTTTIYVTHDQVEAMTLADRIVILKDGYIQQIGTPVEVYEQPVNEFVATFIGNPPMNLAPAEVTRSNGSLYLKCKHLEVPIPSEKQEKLATGTKVTMGIRPDDILHADRALDIDDTWKYDGSVIIAETIGGQSIIELDIGGNEMVAVIEGRFLPQPGQTIRVAINLKHLHMFDPATGNKIDSTEIH